MTWVPTRRQRAAIRARFAELTGDFPKAANSGPSGKPASGITALQPSLRPKKKVTAAKASNSQDRIVLSAKEKSPRPSVAKEWNRHHVPPCNPDAKPRFIKRKNVMHHQAYHALFSAAKSYEDACLILWRDWWEQCLNDFTCRYPDTSEEAQNSNGALI